MALPPNVASDISEDGKVELYLFWQTANQVVDVSTFLHYIPSGKKAELVRDYPAGNNKYYYEYRLVQGTILSVHTEHFEYQLPSRPKTVDVTFVGGASQAKAVAL